MNFNKSTTYKIKNNKLNASNSIAIDKLSVVIPVYNSENTIEPLVDNVIATLSSSFSSLEIILVNDGSQDKSHDHALKSHLKHPETVKYINLSRNFGEHNAVMCGLNYSTGDCAAIIDDDFQNPPSEILKLTDHLEQGYDVVYSYYSEKKHHWFRNFGSSFNDWMATKLLKKPPGLYLSSFKVIRRSLINDIITYTGPFPYIDGVLLRATDRIGSKLVEHSNREEGKSNYTLSKLILLWLNMFTGFSVVPLRIASFIGIFMSALTPFFILFYVISYNVGGVFVKQVIPPGWASLIILINFFGGLQLLVLGIIGEYLGRLFITSNQSPQFLVREVFMKKDYTDLTDHNT